MAHDQADQDAVSDLHQQDRTSGEITVGLDIPRPLVDGTVESVPRPRPGLAPLLPWDVAPEHENDENATMLRLEQRRRMGLDLDDRELDELNDWMVRLSDLHGVVDYSPARGFFWVRRVESDRDIVRRPVVA